MVCDILTVCQLMFIVGKVSMSTANRREESAAVTRQLLVDEAARLLGLQSDKIESVLGYRGRATMVHRDELVLFDND